MQKPTSNINCVFLLENKLESDCFDTNGEAAWAVHKLIRGEQRKLREQHQKILNWYPFLLLFQFYCTINTLLLRYLKMIYFKMIFLYHTSFNTYCTFCEIQLFNNVKDSPGTYSNPIQIHVGSKFNNSFAYVQCTL